MSRSSPSGAGPSRCCCPRPPGGASPPCSWSASSGRGAGRRTRPGRTSPAPSPTPAPAAGEVRERVRARFLELGERESARDTEAAFVGTFHAFCARLLRANPLLAGLDPEFAILDEGLAGRLRQRAFCVRAEE